MEDGESLHFPCGNSLLEGICIMKSDVSNCSLFQELLLNTENHP